MKKMSVFVATTCVALNMIVLAPVSQGARLSSPTTVDQEEPLLKTVRGTVKAESDKLTFVTDEDGKSWEVMNPVVLKGHEGEHVEVNAHLYVKEGLIHIHNVKVLKNSKENLSGIPSRPM